MRNKSIVAFCVLIAVSAVTVITVFPRPIMSFEEIVFVPPAAIDRRVPKGFLHFFVLQLFFYSNQFFNSLLIVQQKPYTGLGERKKKLLRDSSPALFFHFFFLFAFREQ